MKSVEASEVRRFLLERFSEPIVAKGLRADEVPDDFDLLTEGIIDSFGILELVGALEERFGLEIDYEELDPEGLTLLGPLSRYIERKSRGGGG